MTDEEIKTTEVKNLTTSNNQWDELEAELSSLIADENSGLAELAKFNKNLSKNQGNKLSPTHLKQMKADLQNG